MEQPLDDHELQPLGDHQQRRARQDVLLREKIQGNGLQRLQDDDGHQHEREGRVRPQPRDLGHEPGHQRPVHQPGHRPPDQRQHDAVDQEVEDGQNQGDRRQGQFQDAPEARPDPVGVLRSTHENDSLEAVRKAECALSGLIATTPTSASTAHALPKQPARGVLLNDRNVQDAFIGRRAAAGRSPAEGRYFPPPLRQPECANYVSRIAADPPGAGGREKCGSAPSRSPMTPHHREVAPALSDTPDYSGFLFAQVWTEPSGMTLSVVSALARLNLDPSREAVRLATMPRAAAAIILSKAIANLPNPPPPVDVSGPSRPPIKLSPHLPPPVRFAAPASAPRPCPQWPIIPSP